MTSRNHKDEQPSNGISRRNVLRGTVLTGGILEPGSASFLFHDLSSAPKQLEDPSAIWDEIESLRTQQIERLRNGSPPDPQIDQRIEDLLRQLEQNGDIHAAAQRSILAITRLLEQGSITRCEAFARAMQSLATHVQRIQGEFDPKEVLKLAWGYLASQEAQNTPRYRPFTSTKYRRSHLFAEEREARENYAGTNRPVNWTDKHDSSEGSLCSGWSPPLPNDPDPFQGLGGKQDHFLFNALGTCNLGQIFRQIRDAAEHEEPSSTDRQMNQLGERFGSRLCSGRIELDEIADWLRSRLCVTPPTDTRSLLNRVKLWRFEYFYSHRYERRWDTETDRGYHIVTKEMRGVTFLEGSYPLWTEWEKRIPDISARYNSEYYNATKWGNESEATETGENNADYSTAGSFSADYPTEGDYTVSLPQVPIETEIDRNGEEGEGFQVFIGREFTQSLPSNSCMISGSETEIQEYSERMWNWTVLPLLQ